ISEFYVSRDDLPALQAYLEANRDPTAKGLMSRCRIQYLNLCATHTKLIMLLIDESEQSSFAEGKRLLDSCSSLAQNLLSNLGTVEDPWGIVDQSSFGSLGSVERSTSIASFAGLVNLSLEAPEGPETVIAGLLSDIGLLDQHPAAAKKMRASGFSDFDSEELKSYHLHPLTGLNRCLSRKLPIPDNIKNMVLCTHETRDQKGFPNRIAPDKIPYGSMILQFCELVDSLAIHKMGQQKRTIKEIQASILEQELKNASRFDLAFLSELKKKYC
ncbi:MAG: HD domain-containing phosphohydrolase, partial [Pseudobdellovibrionaceae bacterium]